MPPKRGREPADPRTTKWVFTLNNYTDEDEERVKQLAERCKYIVVGREVGPEGTPHLQGSVWLKNAAFHSQMKKLLPRAWIEVMSHDAKGTGDYCAKDGDCVVNIPRPAKTQGRRTDIELVRELVAEKAPLHEIWGQVGWQAFQYAKAGMAVMPFVPEWLDDKEVLWIHGEAGVGKSRYAVDLAGTDRYMKKRGKWWDGYMGQGTVIFDDFRPDWCMFDELLSWLDKYTFQGEIKGSQVNVTAGRVVVTTPHSPEDTFAGITDENLRQLTRRITRVIHMEAEPDN